MANHTRSIVGNTRMASFFKNAAIGNGRERFMILLPKRK